MFGAELSGTNRPYASKTGDTLRKLVFRQILLRFRVGENRAINLRSDQVPELNQLCPLLKGSRNRAMAQLLKPDNEKADPRREKPNRDRTSSG